MLRISRREYKVMLDQRLFIDRKASVRDFFRELHACARRLKGIEWDGKTKKTKKRELVFLDTPDYTIALNRLIFRKRTELAKPKVTEYTLKCRSPDRYVAAGAELKEGKGFKDQPKFEEDIGSPFTVRFSHSNTIEGPDKSPKTLKTAAELFPIIGQLKRDDDPVAGNVELRPVNALSPFERVYHGPVLKFSDVEAEVALILWSDGREGRPLVAEFSFRYEQKNENFPVKTAKRAMEFFEEIQRMDWCLPGARTKTQFAYQA